MNKTKQPKKDKPVDVFINDKGERVEVLPNGKTLTEKYASEIWGKNNNIQSQLNSLR